MAETGILIEHLFRHQAGRIVAHLTRALGPSSLDLAEDMVQGALLRALETWPYQGVPENPAGWLFQVARNAALDHLRHQKMAGDKASQLEAEWGRSYSNPVPILDGSPQSDDELRLIFMCCHPSIPIEARVALSLKTVGGFSVGEIAGAFLAEETAIAQRLVRAKRQIRAEGLSMEMPRGGDLAMRLEPVLEVIYLLFNESYVAHQGEHLIRQDLCAEALRLGQLLASSTIATPAVHALMAVMALLAARLPARTNEAGDLILLEDQDRSKWDRQLLALGFRHFDLSMAGGELTRYHVEAAIAATHARARGLSETDWPMILDLYGQLMELNGSPVVRLNRAVAMGKVHGPELALAALEGLKDDPKMRNYYLFLAVRGHLLLQLGLKAEAADCFTAALERPCSEPERRFLRRKLAEISLITDEEFIQARANGEQDIPINLGRG